MLQDMKKQLLPWLIIPFLAGCGDQVAMNRPPDPIALTKTEHPAPDAIVQDQDDEQAFARTRAPGPEFKNLFFVLPHGMSAEYISSIQSLNLYETEGGGSTIDRSKIFIRYFDANRFLTLPTVTIFETADLTVGTEGYVARRYEIEKKPGIPGFPGQPAWRNRRHIVTDTRKRDGFGRYFVIAKSPDLELSAYEAFLSSIKIE